MNDYHPDTVWLLVLTNLCRDPCRCRPAGKRHRCRSLTWVAQRCASEAAQNFCGPQLYRFASTNCSDKARTQRLNAAHPPAVWGRAECLIAHISQRSNGPRACLAASHAPSHAVINRPTANPARAQIDLRYAGDNEGELSVVVAPVLRFLDVGFNADVRIEVRSLPSIARSVTLRTLLTCSVSWS